MRTLKHGIIGVLLATTLAVPLMIRHCAEVRFLAMKENLQLKTDLVSDLLAENGRLSNVLAKAKSTQSPSDAELTELLKLRNEVGKLREAPKEQDRLRREIHRIRNHLQDLVKEKGSGGDNPTALLADEMELRQTRIAQLKQWLEESPEEKIPELQFLSEDDWVKSADWQRVTDEEYRLWMSAQRGNAEMKFADMMFKAVKQFAQTNDDQFPSDLLQLKPYFKLPIDEAILQRYEIVPANSLMKSLAEGCGELVITQRTPVNRERDLRSAIGLKNMRTGGFDGRWDSVQ